MDDETPSFSDLHRVGLLQPIAQAKIEELVRGVIADLSAVPWEASYGVAESGLENVWEEYTYQVRNGESAAFGLYGQRIEELAAARLRETSRETRALLWVVGEPYFEQDFEYDGMDMPSDGEVTDGLVEHIRQLVTARAADEGPAGEPEEDESPEAWIEDRESSDW